MQSLSPTDKLHVQSWLAIADLDLRVAERMYADDPAFYGYHIPFAYQQAVEKYAKAVLIARSSFLPKVSKPKLRPRSGS